MPSDDPEERRGFSRRGTPVEPRREDEDCGSSDDPENAHADLQANRKYPTRDVPPDVFPGDAEEWTTLTLEQRRIEYFAALPVDERDPSILEPNGGPRSATDSDADDAGGSTDEPRPPKDRMDAGTCAEIRETMNDALTAREVVENYPDLHTSKIMRHAYGECNHESVEVPATASPQIGPDECFAMRDDYREGDRVAAVADSWARSENTVTRHIFGRCSHDPRPRDVAPSRVNVVECERIRRTFEGNEKVSVREVACALRLREEVIATHLFDYCRHIGNDDPSVPAADPGDADLWDGRDV